MTVGLIWIAAVVFALLIAMPWAIRDLRRAARLPPRRHVKLRRKRNDDR